SLRPRPRLRVIATRASGQRDSLADRSRAAPSPASGGSLGFMDAARDSWLSLRPGNRGPAQVPWDWMRSSLLVIGVLVACSAPTTTRSAAPATRGGAPCFPERD